MKIKAIFFDMDGVLIDAKDWHYKALNRALNLFGFTISQESHLTTFDGLPTRVKLKILSEAKGLPLGLHEFLNDLKQAYTIQISHQECKPKFNHQYALSKLKSEGYKLALCSNSIRNTVDLLMKLSALDDYLDLVISNEDVEFSKPNPSMYLKSMEYFSLRPEECLVLEDNENGIKAAIESGAHLLKIGVPDDVTYESIKSKIAELEKN